MKYLKSRNKYLTEAKIRDVILPRQLKEVKARWGERYLDYEEIDPTEAIKQGRWKLDEDDKLKVLGRFFGPEGKPCNIKTVFSIFEAFPDLFVERLIQSIDIALLKPHEKIIIENFNPKKPTIDQLGIVLDPIFRKLSSDTSKDVVIAKDASGRPVLGDDGKPVKIAKEKGAPIYERNLVNIKNFADSYNRCYEANKINLESFNDWNLTNLVSISKENHNSEYKFDFKIFDTDLYLSIKHHPKDILNMSISKFYSSCQHLYTGGYRDQLLANVFDPNSIPAFLLFDTPIFWGKDQLSEFLPLSRMMIRSIENYTDIKKPAEVFFDRAYPDRMKEVFEEMVVKYSENKATYKGKNYIFSPDVDISDKGLRNPYMDRLGIETKTFIGVNTKGIYLNAGYDWRNVRISPKAKIKEIVIETNQLPANMFQIPLTPDWIKFKYMKINDIKVFQKILTDSVAFSKCKFDVSVLTDLSKFNGDLKKLQINSCDISGAVDLKIFPKLETLELLYTLDDLEQLKEMISGLSNLKNLSISGDLATTREQRQFIGTLKANKIKVQIVGPVI